TEMVTTWSDSTLGGRNVVMAANARGDVLLAWDRGLSPRAVEAATRPAGGTWTAAVPACAPRSVYFLGDPWGGAGIDDAGRAVVVCWSELSPAIEVRETPAGGTNWTGGLLPGNAVVSTRPLVGLTPDGGLTLAWVEAGAIGTRHRPAGGDWGPMTPLSAGLGGSQPQPPALSAGRDGEVIVAWRESADASLWAAVQRAGVWSSPARIASPGGAAYDLSVAAGAAGEGVVAWREGADDGVRAVVRARGSWTVPVSLGTGDRTVAAAGPAGDGLVLWRRLPAPPDCPVVAARHVDGTWGAPEAIMPRSLNPAVAVGPGGDAIAGTSLSGDSACSAARDPVLVRGLDASPPRVDALTLPARATTGVPIAVGASLSDAWSGLLEPAWDFGDGTPAVTGAQASHTFAVAGTYTVRLATADTAGNSGHQERTVLVEDPPAPPAPGPAGAPGPGAGPAPPPVARDLAAPVLRARLVGVRGRLVRVRVAVSEPARVTLVAWSGRRRVGQAVAGFRRAGTRVVALRIGARPRSGLLTLRVRARDPAGNAAGRALRVRLR
ncbi:MAG: PKD domain-containing protein, partial [Thermoleophilia bacterium]|nr:PKD domain-containing protein [Thermoleophilia bacterium]